MGDGSDVIVRRLHRTVFPVDAFHTAIAHNKSADSRSQLNVSASLRNCIFAAIVKISERNLRYANAIPTARREKRFPENIDAVPGIDAVQLFIEGANQDDFPETANRAICLAMLPEPRKHRYTVPAIRQRGQNIGRTSAAARNRKEGLRDCNFVRPAQKREHRKRKRHVQRRG
jgi:hypothetical protein